MTPPDLESRVLVGGRKPEDIEREYFQKKRLVDQQAGQQVNQQAAHQPPPPAGRAPASGTVILERRMGAYQSYPGSHYEYYAVSPVRFGATDYEVHINTCPLGRWPDFLNSIPGPTRFSTFWTKEAEKAFTSNEHEGFHAASAPFYASLFLTLYSMKFAFEFLPEDQQEGRLMSVRNLMGTINTMLESNEIATLTNGVIPILPSQSNPTISTTPNYKAVHNYRTGSHRESRILLCGGLSPHIKPLPLLKGSPPAQEFAQGFFGMSVDELNRGFQWITSTHPLRGGVSEGWLCAITGDDPSPSGIPLTMRKDPLDCMVKFSIDAIRHNTAAIGVRIYDPDRKAVLL